MPAQALVLHHEHPDWTTDEIAREIATDAGRASGIGILGLLAGARLQEKGLGRLSRKLLVFYIEAITRLGRSTTES
jgi:hypothetical protein